MTKQAHTQSENGEKQYATRDDFLKIINEDLPSLYQLSLLLTGDHQKAERCFVAGVEDCAKENRVFREWARARAKRVIAENAIRELDPRPKCSNSPSRPSLLSHNQSSSRMGHFAADAVLGLADFERFVFVLCVLEQYRIHECALLLGCSAPDVRESRLRAIAELAGLHQVVPFERKAASAVVRFNAVTESLSNTKEPAVER